MEPGHALYEGPIDTGSMSSSLAVQLSHQVMVYNDPKTAQTSVCTYIVWQAFVMMFSLMSPETCPCRH